MRLAESRKQGGMASFSGVTRSMAARERRLFLVTVALSPRLLGRRHLGSLGRMKKGGLGVPAIKQALLLYVPLIFSTKIKRRRY